MNPTILAAATAAHAWARHAPLWGGTQVSGTGFFWLGLFNVVMLVAFLVIVASRRDRADGGGGPHPDPAAARSTPATATAAVRASDAERDETAAVLSRAIGAGCLEVEEGVDRIDAVYHARFRHQLTALVDDLPESMRQSPSLRTGRLDRDLRDFAGMALVAAVLLQALVGAWELWPVAAAALLPFAFRRLDRDSDRATRA